MAPTLDRNDKGQFVAQHSDADVLAAVQEHSPAATSDVAGELGIAHQSAAERLNKLAGTGRVDRKKIAATLVWTLTDDRDNDGETA